jgi:hypothetical protein
LSEGTNPEDESFILRSVQGPAQLQFRGRIPRGLEGYDGTTFVAALTGPVTASVEVYDIQPQGWTAFFRDMADSWRGWHGEKKHESLEGHLRIVCTHDSAGHITARIRLLGDMMGSNWIVENSLFLEAGQLEVMAAHAARYFG